MHNLPYKKEVDDLVYTKHSSTSYFTTYILQFRTA